MLSLADALQLSAVLPALICSSCSVQHQPLPVSSKGAVGNAGSGAGRKLECQLLCVCLTCGALALCLLVKGQCYLR